MPATGGLTAAFRRTWSAPVTGSAARGRAAERGFFLAGERVGLAGPGDADPLDGDPDARLLVHQRDGGQCLVDRRRAGALIGAVHVDQDLLTDTEAVLR